MLNIDLSNKIALVTGGVKGVGKGIVYKLHEAGATVCINYRSKFSENKANRIIDSLGNERCMAIKADVGISKEVNLMFEEIIKTYGKIDILVNNAGITSVGDIESIEDNELDKVLTVNTKGSFYTCRQAVKYMKSTGGSIVNVASSGLYTGGGGGPHYSSSKAAILGLTRNLSKTYGKYNIRTNALAISLIDTDLFRNRYKDINDIKRVIDSVPIKRLGTPDDVGSMVAFIASPLATYLNGEIIVLDGGRLFA